MEIGELWNSSFFLLQEKKLIEEYVFGLVNQ
jgi:hypothetical protein